MRSLSIFLLAFLLSSANAETIVTEPRGLLLNYKLVEKDNKTSVIGNIIIEGVLVGVKDGGPILQQAKKSVPGIGYECVQEGTKLKTRVYVDELLSSSYAQAIWIGDEIKFQLQIKTATENTVLALDNYNNRICPSDIHGATKTVLDKLISLKAEKKLHEINIADGKVLKINIDFY